MKLIRNKIKRAFLGNPIDGITEEDVLVCSYPKTGSTYTRFVLANIVRGLSSIEDAVDFHSLGEILPECHKNNLRSFEWTGLPLPRFVKTHEYFHENSLYRVPRVLYIVRDPRDTMISYYHYTQKRKSNRFDGSFLEFVVDNKFGIESYSRHVEEWYQRANWCFRYEDLMTNPAVSFRALLDEVVPGVVSNDMLGSAIEKSSPDRIKRLEAKKSRPGQDENFDRDFRFVRNASTGQWKTELSDEEADLVVRKCSELLRKIYALP